MDEEEVIAVGSAVISKPVFIRYGQAINFPIPYRDARFSATTANPNATYSYTWEWRSRQTSGKRGNAAPGWTPTSGYVAYARWYEAPTTSSVFVQRFPCGTWTDVRVTAAGGGGSTTSAVSSTYVGGSCGSGGNGGGAFAENGSSAGKPTNVSAVFDLGVPTPNPATGSVRFDVQSRDGATVAIYDALGRKVAQPEMVGDHVQVDLSGWPAGVYTARLTAGRDATTRRFVVTR